MTTNAEEETNPPENARNSMAGWLSWQSVGVPIQRSWVQIPLQSKFSDFDYSPCLDLILTSKLISIRVDYTKLLQFQGTRKLVRANIFKFQDVRNTKIYTNTSGPQKQYSNICIHIQSNWLPSDSRKKQSKLYIGNLLVLRILYAIFCVS